MIRAVRKATTWSSPKDKEGLAFPAGARKKGGIEGGEKITTPLTEAEQEGALKKAEALTRLINHHVTGKKIEEQRREDGQVISSKKVYLTDWHSKIA